MLRPSADDDGVSPLRRVLNDAFGKLQNALAIHHVELVRVQASFITSAQKGFEEPVVEWIGALLANLDDGLGTIGEQRDLLGQQLIPKLPAEPRRQQLSDFASAASVFPFNGDDFDHVGAMPPIRSPPLLLHIIPLRSTHRHFPATTRIIFLQNKSEPEHDRCSHGKNHEGIDIGQARRLRCKPW